MMKLLKEPLIQFLLIAIVLFSLESLWIAKSKDEILIDEITARFLINENQSLTPYPLTAKEKKAILDTYVEDEMLAREGYKLGLNKDARIRREIILKMRALELANVNVQPTEKNLREFYEVNRQQYIQPARFLIKQLYFRDMKSIPSHFNDDQNIPLRLSEQELAITLGISAAKKIVSIQDNDWHGPIITTKGIFFIRILDRYPSHTPTFEDVENYVKIDWINTQKNRLISEKIKQLRKDYKVVFDFNWDKI